MPSGRLCCRLVLSTQRIAFFKTFLDEERDPLLATLMFAQMTKEGTVAYSRESEPFWAQHQILQQADATLQERRRALQRPFWSRRDDR